VVKRVAKVEMIFLYQWRVACGSGVDSMFRFRLEWRRRDEAMLKDEVEATSSSWLNGKEL
jgi:hypothetical protein